MSSYRAVNSHCVGFTLLEVILSMAVVAMVAGILATAVTVAFKSRTIGEKRVETGRSVELVMESIRADLQCAMPPSRGTFEGSFEGSNQQIDNIEADDLVFYGTAPAPYHPEGSNGEIKQFEITAYQPAGSNDHVLVRRTYNNLLSPTGTPTGGSIQGTMQDEEILCRNMQGFTLQYYDGSTWQQSWDSTVQGNLPANSLPLAVMVTLTLAASDKTDAAGKSMVTSYTRIFALPCNGPPVSNTATAAPAAAAAPAAKGGAK